MPADDGFSPAPSAADSSDPVSIHMRTPHQACLGEGFFSWPPAHLSMIPSAIALLPTTHRHTDKTYHPTSSASLGSSGSQALAAREVPHPTHEFSLDTCQTRYDPSVRILHYSVQGFGRGRQHRERRRVPADALASRCLHTGP